jgi:uncharacterized DUF497 family protein
MAIDFDWDIVKAEKNHKKHGISFEEAKEVFYDFSAYIFLDEKHSRIEQRELIIGYSSSGRLLIVCFTVRDHKIRIINARLTNKVEKKIHEENRQNRV